MSTAELDRPTTVSNTDTQANKATRPPRRPPETW